MYSKLHRPSRNALNMSENAGSSVKLASYLNKEKTDDKMFFSHDSDNVSFTEVVEKIDNNKRTLKRGQDKFYMLSYNPSHNELKHLIERVTGKVVDDFNDLNAAERQAVLIEFRNYVRECMEIYANKFNRQRLLHADDLVYFGRIEEERHYNYTDQEVQTGLKKRGDAKPGLNLHAHIIVSRMDKSQTISLSPLTKSRGNTNCLNGKEVKNGFDMSGWQMESVFLFRDKYGYASVNNYYHSDTDIVFKKLQNRIHHETINELTSDMYEEKKIVRNTKVITGLLTGNKSSMKSFLKSKIRQILSDNEPII